MRITKTQKEQQGPQGVEKREPTLQEVQDTARERENMIRRAYRIAYGGIKNLYNPQIFNPIEPTGK